MLRKVIMAAAILTTVTAALIYINMGRSKPKMDMVAAVALFDRYPHWQPSAAQSREVVLDPAFERLQAVKFAPPDTLRGDPFGIWQPARNQQIVVEFGLGRGYGE